MSTRWLMTWTLAIATFSAAIILVESTWRGLGYAPTVSDTEALWKCWYEYASCRRPEAIAVIGSSRIQTGLFAPQIRQRLPDYRVAQLGKDGGRSPIGVLRKFAGDADFRGVVICDTLTPFLLRHEWNDQQAFYNSQVTLGDSINTMSRSFVEDILSINCQRTGVEAALKQIIDTGQFPPSDPVRMRRDRTQVIAFEAVHGIESDRIEGAATYRRIYERASHPTPDDLLDELKDIDQFVLRIQARGGQVVFVRMPTSDGIRAVEDEFHPRAEYWDRFAAECSGIWIHSTDLSGSDSLACPDGSHLDLNGAITFTNALIDELLRCEVVREPKNASGPEHH